MAITVELKVIPSSGRSGWMRDKSGMLKCFLISPPEKGKANAELLKNIAQALGIARNSLSIISGSQSRKKVIKIDADMSYIMFLQAIGIEVQGEEEKQMMLFNNKK